MKKITFVSALAVCVMLSGCEGRSDSGSGSFSAAVDSDPAENGKTVSDRTDMLKELIELPPMIGVNSDKLAVYYGIDPEDVEEFSAYVCGAGAPDEFGIFTAADGCEDKLKEALEARISAQRKTYEEYPAAAEYMYKFDGCFVEISGSEVLYAVCADNDKAKEILEGGYTDDNSGVM